MFELKRNLFKAKARNTDAVGQSSHEQTDDLLDEIAIYREALNKIACWGEGPRVTGSFDEPGSAKIAREALSKPYRAPLISSGKSQSTDTLRKQEGLLSTDKGENK